MSTDEKALNDFETRLAMPVPGVERRDGSIAQDEMALFMKSTGATGVAGGA